METQVHYLQRRRPFQMLYCSGRHWRNGKDESGSDLALGLRNISPHVDIEKQEISNSVIELFHMYGNHSDKRYDRSRNTKFQSQLLGN